MARRRRRSNYPYRYTPARQKALRRAQEISARKRRNKRIKTAAIVAGGVTGVAASAYLGHKYGGRAGSVANSVKTTRPFTAASLAQKRTRAAVQPHAKELKRTIIKQVSHSGPNVIAPNKANVDKPNRPYNVDRFINRDLLYGRKLKRGTKQHPKYVDRQIQKHQENKGKLTNRPVDDSKIIKQMIGDGTVRGRVSGKRTKTKTNRQTGAGRRTKAQNVQAKAFQQWLKDNPNG